jgi:hypothetical protein
MVWRRMGLLDDAIRDHLELKRLRGADPGEVAREEREALETDHAGGPAALDEELATAVEDLDGELDGETMPVRASSNVTSTSGVDRDMADEPASSADPPIAAEETAELDMSAVMDEDEAGSAADGSPSDEAAATPLRGGPPIEDLNEDQLEWEVPGEAPGEFSTGTKHRDPALGDDGR